MNRKGDWESEGTNTRVVLVYAEGAVKMSLLVVCGAAIAEGRVVL
jgi:hypothetical protein